MAELGGRRKALLVFVVLAMFVVPRAGVAEEEEARPKEQESATESTAKSMATDETAEETAESTPSHETPAATEDSPLVRAAKAARKSEKLLPANVRLTDEDAKKSTGKLIELSAIPMPPTRPEEVEARARDKETARLQQQRVDDEKARYKKAIDETEEKIRVLSDELRTVEEQYYDEQDPAARDEIQTRFESANKELSELKDYLERAKKLYDGLDPK